VVDGVGDRQEPERAIGMDPGGGLGVRRSGGSRRVDGGRVDGGRVGVRFGLEQPVITPRETEKDRPVPVFFVFGD